MQSGDASPQGIRFRGGFPMATTLGGSRNAGHHPAMPSLDRDRSGEVSHSGNPTEYAPTATPVRWFQTQRSMPELQNSFLESLWKPCEPLDDFPTYTAVSQFIGRVEIYKSKLSVVWKCNCKVTQMPLVLKAYDKKKMNLRHRKNVRREIDILTRLHGSESSRFPGIVNYLGTFEDRYYIYIVQDRCSRGDLFKELLRKGGFMEERRVCTEVVVPLLFTVSHLHQQGIAHRDIKPENIFFTADDELKLGDFGLAIDYSLDKPISRVGTLDYMAPEVLKMKTPDQLTEEELDDIEGYNEKVDIWSLGILTYELLAGRPPFEVEDSDQTAALIMHAELDLFPHHISHQAGSFIKKALTKNPAERLSAQELLDHPWVKQHYQISIPRDLASAKQSSEQQSPFLLEPRPAGGSNSEAGGSRGRSESFPLKEKTVPKWGDMNSNRDKSTPKNGSARTAKKAQLLQLKKMGGTKSDKNMRASSAQAQFQLSAPDKDRLLRPRWQSCPGGHSSCLSRSPVEVSVKSPVILNDGPASPQAAWRQLPLDSEPSTPPPATRQRTEEPQAPASPLDDKLMAQWRYRMQLPPGHKPQQLNTGPDVHSASRLSFSHPQAHSAQQLQPLVRSSTVCMGSSRGNGSSGVSFGRMERPSRFGAPATMSIPSSRLAAASGMGPSSPFEPKASGASPNGLEDPTLHHAMGPSRAREYMSKQRL